MNKNKVLTLVEKNELLPEDAYKKMYKDHMTVSSGKATFVKVDIRILDEPRVTKLLKVLTFIPFPLFLVKMFAGIITSQLEKHTDISFTKEDFLSLIDASKGLIVDVDTNDAKIGVKVV